MGGDRRACYSPGELRQPIATLTLSTRKPWAIDQTYFSASRRPFVSHGDGRRSGHEMAGRCLFGWMPYEAEAGAGEFYRKYAPDRIRFAEDGRKTFVREDLAAVPRGLRAAPKKRLTVSIFLLL